MARVSEPQDEPNGLYVVFLCYAVIDNCLEERIQKSTIQAWSWLLQGLYKSPTLQQLARPALTTTKQNGFCAHCLLLFFKQFWIFKCLKCYMHECFARMYVYAAGALLGACRVRGGLELELLMVVSHHAGARNWTLVFRKRNKCSFLTADSFLQITLLSQVTKNKYLGGKDLKTLWKAQFSDLWLQ